MTATQSRDLRPVQSLQVVCTWGFSTCQDGNPREVIFEHNGYLSCVVARCMTCLASLGGGGSFEIVEVASVLSTEHR